MMYPIRSLFFSSCRKDPDLHSFPTRRSSDLDRQIGDPRIAVGHLELLHHNEALGASKHGLIVDRLADRKSTRLNSSHSQISYAVFCLKKKNGSGQQTQIWRSQNAATQMTSSQLHDVPHTFFVFFVLPQRP